MVKGLVNRILPFSSVDGPGNRTAIFLQGCNFNCLYCHNPETINVCSNCGICVNGCPKNALSLNNSNIAWSRADCSQCDSCLKTCRSYSSPKAVSMSVEEVVSEINKTRAFISGITVSGGECTLQLEFLTELFKEVKKLGLTTFADTNGSIPLWDKEAFLESMDMAMLDVKAFDSEEHKRLTGMDNNVVLKNFQYLAERKKLYEVRTVIVPEVLDNLHNVDCISRIIASYDDSIRYKIIKYRPMGVRSHMIKSYTPLEAMITELVEVAKQNGCKNVISV